jgi:hypothetical protein
MTRLSTPAKLARQASYWRTHGRPDVADRLEAALNQSGRCRICGRAIRDEQSLTRGVGPECWKKEEP